MRSVAVSGLAGCRRGAGFGVAWGLLLMPLMFDASALAGEAVDPGVRTAPASAGGPLAALSESEQRPFWNGWDLFRQKFSVSGTLESGVGLGPAFNAISCAQCHAQPAAGGSSASMLSPQVRRIALRDHRFALAREPNPQSTLGNLHRRPGAEQLVPPFITSNGPIRVVRFIHKPDGAPDGSVHPIFTISGRIDAPSCHLEPPDFDTQLARHNLAFRVPIPMFGDGLIAAIPDATLEESLRSTAERRREFTIGGRFNRDAAGRIMRFGWKAQIRTLQLFTARAQHLEMGVINGIYPRKRFDSPGCLPVRRIAESGKRRYLGSAAASESGSPGMSEIDSITNFVRLSAPPAPDTHTPSQLRGQRIFLQIGCDLCHTPTLHTGPSRMRALADVEVHPYSDFALHHMGPGLADQISQGLAMGDEFRTAPLWGLGQRIFFLHDGRTTDLVKAILAHASGTKRCHGNRGSGEVCASEANLCVKLYEQLPDPQKQDLLNFLRSL